MTPCVGDRKNLLRGELVQKNRAEMGKRRLRVKERSWEERGRTYNPYRLREE